MTDTDKEVRTVEELKEIALWDRRKVIEMAVAADSGHVTTACSQAEILTALYFGGVLRYDPTDPKWEGRDVFLLSKGQGGIGLYPLLARAGYFPESDLGNFCGEGSHIGVHAEWNCPGVEMISGSLGHGLPVGTGFAAAFKNAGKDNLVFVLLGDGELHEGSNWEAMMAATHLKLGNLVVIVDRNGQNTIGRTREPMPSPKDGPNLDPLRDKFEAFGFNVSVVDGHDVAEVRDELELLARWGRQGRQRPTAVICNTDKGHGLPIADQRDWHYRVPKGNDLVACCKALEMDYVPRAPEASRHAVHGVAMRDRFFDALYEHFKQDPDLVLVTADNGWPGIDQFAALPGQFYQVGIAEQQMVGMASGLAMAGKRVYCYAISPFVTTRVHEFLKLDVACANLPVTMIGVGAGFAYADMSVSHHQVEDIAIVRALPNMRIFSPSDGYAAAAMAHETVTKPGPTYVRLDRGGVPDVGPVSSLETTTGFRTPIYRSEAPITIVTTGFMVHTAMKVAGQIYATVIDLFRLKPLSDTFVSTIAGTQFVVTLEEHQLDGGLGSIISEMLADVGFKKRLLRIAVPNQFTFDLGGRELIHKKYGLDAESVVKRINEWKQF